MAWETRTKKEEEGTVAFADGRHAKGGERDRLWEYEGGASYRNAGHEEAGRPCRAFETGWRTGKRRR